MGIFSFYLFKVQIISNFPSKTTLKVKIKAFYRLCYRLSCIQIQKTHIIVK